MRPDQEFAVDDQHHRHALDTSGREPTGNFFPQQGRDLVTDDAVEDTASLLGIDHVHVDRTGILERPFDGLLGHLVEDDSLEPLRRQAQFLGQVPGDRLTLTVEVGRQPDVIGLLGNLLQLADGLLLAVNRDVDRLEVVVEIDPGNRQVHSCRIATRKITDVTHRRLDLEPRAEVLVDRLRLGRRLDNHQVPPTVTARGCGSASLGGRLLGSRLLLGRLVGGGFRHESFSVVGTS